MGTIYFVGIIESKKEDRRWCPTCMHDFIDNTRNKKEEMGRRLYTRMYYIENCLIFLLPVVVIENKSTNYRTHVLKKRELVVFGILGKKTYKDDASVFC